MKDREKEKNSRKRISSIGLKPRVAIIVVLSLVMTAVMIIRLFTLQIINGESYDENHTMQILRTKTLKPTRGEIYDVNGKLLAYNQLVYDVTMEDSGSYGSNYSGYSSSSRSSHGSSSSIDFANNIAIDKRINFCANSNIFLKTHQQNLNFSPYYRGVFFAMVKSNVNKV